jgi:hypothetical protein
MLSINHLPDYEFRTNESMNDRSNRRMVELRTRSESKTVRYITTEDKFGGRRDTRDRTNSEYVKLYEGAIVGIEITEANTYGHKVDGFMVEGIDNLALTVETIEKDNFYGKKITKIYKIRSMVPVMMHRRTSVYEESTLFGTKTTTVHVEETYTPHRPTVAARPVQSTEMAGAQAIGMLLGAALIGLSKARR